MGAGRQLLLLLLNIRSVFAILSLSRFIKLGDYRFHFCQCGCGCVWRKCNSFGSPFHKLNGNVFWFQEQASNQKRKVVRLSEEKPNVSGEGEEVKQQFLDDFPIFVHKEFPLHVPPALQSPSSLTHSLQLDDSSRINQCYLFDVRLGERGRTWWFVGGQCLHELGR